MAHSSANTKSIDVGSIFLMDLSVHESDLSCGDLTDIDSIHDNDSVFPANLLMQQQSTHLNSAISKYRSDYLIEHLDSSLNRLASAINQDCHHDDDDKRHVSDIEIREAIEKRNSSLITTLPTPSNANVHSRSSSCLDGSSVDSISTGSSCATNSLSASFLTNSEVGDEERASATTREDSGVLDMRDLDSQLNDSFDDKHHAGLHNLDHVYANENQCSKDKPISHDRVIPTNQSKNATLTTCNWSQNFQTSVQANYSQLETPTRLLNSSSSNNNHLKQHHHQRKRVDRLMSASLPIKVPVRQMKKDMKQLKLGLSTKTHPTECESDTRILLPSSTDQILDERSANAGIDDFEEFLEQEYNDNHHNHYPADEYEREHLKADKNPMELFESIQALARSLHEDAELFGSLPPKRLLESPIRSLALA